MALSRPAGECGGGLQTRVCMYQSGAGKPCSTDGEPYGKSRWCNEQSCCGHRLTDGSDWVYPHIIKSHYTVTCPGSCPDTNNGDGGCGMWHGTCHHNSGNDEDWYTVDSDICSSVFHATGIAGATYEVEVKADFLEAEASQRIPQFTSSTRYGFETAPWPQAYPMLFRVTSVHRPTATDSPKPSLDQEQEAEAQQALADTSSPATITLSDDAVKIMRHADDVKTQARQAVKEAVEASFRALPQMQGARRANRKSLLP